MSDLEYLKKYVEPNKLDEAILKLKNNIPVQYIVGNVNFYGLKINVNENVLIPRFETEELVSRTYKYILKYFSKDIKIADIGTGSGCIAITLKKKLPDSKVVAVDISDKALDVARNNALENNVEIEFLLGNLLEPIYEKQDILISNPPYISEDEEIEDIVKNNEPNIALYASNKGLEFYEKILSSCVNYLNKKNLLAFEIGALQGEMVKKIALKYFPQSVIKIEKDLQNRDRFVFIFNL